MTKPEPRDLRADGRIPIDPDAAAAVVASKRWQVEVTDSGCWLWRGAAQIRVHGRPSLVHRIALVAALGRDLLHGMEAGHMCRQDDHRRCVNPAHLAEQTPQETLLIADNAAAIARCTFPDEGLRILLEAAGVTG